MIWYDSVAFVFKHVYKAGNPSLLERSVFSSIYSQQWCKTGRSLEPNSIFYMDSLLHSLAESSVGCFIGRVFVGVLVYADNIVLLSHMRSLLHVCDVFANDFSVVFNAAESKCLWFKARWKCASCCKNPPSFFWLVAMPMSLLVAGYTLVIYWLQIRALKLGFKNLGF